MAEPWMYPRDATARSMAVDFAQLVASNTTPVGVPAQRALAGISLDSPGEWTFYMQRTAFTEMPDLNVFPANIFFVDVQTGRENVRGKVLASANPFGIAGVSLLQQCMRGIAIHVVASYLDVTVSWLPGDRTVDDAVLSWVAPGRPTEYSFPGEKATETSLAQALANRTRLPTFARRMRVMMMAQSVYAFPPYVAPALVFYQGPSITDQLCMIPFSVGSTLVTEFVVPMRATHYAFVDLGIGANQVAIDHEFICLS